MGQTKVERKDNISNHPTSVTERCSVAIIGMGYVGLPLALLASNKGLRSIGIDTDADKVSRIVNSEVKLHNASLANDSIKTKLKVTGNYSAIKEANIIVICVPTPVHTNHLPDLGPIKNAASMIGKNLHKGQLVILESTVNPGVTESVLLPILEKKSGLKAGKDFYISHCPERINPGDKIWNVENIPRVVGSLEEVGLQKTIDFYKKILTSDIVPMKSLKEAESVKIIENSFRDVNLAFVNEIAMSFSKMGIDVVNVINAASTKPFAFMAHYPGCGVGGHCIPVDPYYLIDYAKKNGFNHRFLSLAREINNDMPRFTVNLLIEALSKLRRSIKNSSIALLGLAYKANIDDDRESPSRTILNILKSHDARISTFDPYLTHKSSAKSLNEAIQNVDAVILATAHDVFLRDLSIERLKLNNVPIVIDGRNCLSKDKIEAAGIIYRGIGR